VLVAAVLAGCGGGSSSSSVSTEASGGGELSKSDYIAAGDAVCTETKEKAKPFKEEIAEAAEGPETPTMIVEVANLAKKAVPIEEEEVEELQELEPPSEDTDAIQTMLGYVEEANESTLPIAEALAEGENAKVEEIEREEEKADLKAKGIAQGYGFKVCGQEEE
jgi:hypothetical protein